MRHCKTCKEEKPKDQFYSFPSKSGKHLPRLTCKNCHRKQVNSARHNRKQILVDYKGGECSASGCTYNKSLRALDFHHVNDAEKSYSISQGIQRNINIKELKKEADKCILLCSNHHAELHYKDHQKFIKGEDRLKWGT
jgi:pyruvate/2-oxoglutarate dehydrogenase complex dihydrolipoamide dehydrogenase (E3) component